MRFAGIDIASETHVVAVVDVEGKLVVKATEFAEDAGGYARLLELLGSPTDCTVAMEATGHYWQNLFAALAAAGFEVSLLNPLRTRRFWYNHEHQHSSIGFVTPADRHEGADVEILAARRRVYERARHRCPARWSRDTRAWSRPDVVLLNPENDVAA